MQLFRVGRTGPTLFLAPTATLRKPPAVHPSLRRGFSPEHSIQRLPFIGGQPPPRDGSLGGRRRGGHRVVFVVLRCRQSQRGQSVVPLGQREPAEQQQSGQRLLRALRPASAGCFYFLDFPSRSFCSSYMRSRKRAAARKSSDLAARSISSRARSICWSREGSVSALKGFSTSAAIM